MSNPNYNPKLQTWLNSHLPPCSQLGPQKTTHPLSMGWGGRVGVRVYVPLPCYPDLPAVGTDYCGVESMGRDYETEGFFSPWISIVMRWHLAFLADVESFLFVSWALLWVHQLHPCWDPWLQLLWLRQSSVSKCCWLISPPASPWFPSGQIPANSCCWSPSAFSRRPPWEGHKTAQGQLSLWCGIHLVHEEKHPTVEASFSWLDVNEISAAPSRDGKAGLTALPSSLS